MLVIDERNLGWKEFRTKFLNTFWHQKHKFRIESRLRARRQENDEPLEHYFFEVINLCDELEEEKGSIHIEGSCTYP